MRPIPSRTPSGSLARMTDAATRARALSGSSPSSSRFGASPEAYAQATRDAWSAGPWSYPSPVTTVAQAAVAARWAFLEAAKESPEDGPSRGAAYFQSLAESAAYDYNRTTQNVLSVLRSVQARLAAAPAIADKVGLLIRQATPAQSPAPARPTPSTNPDASPGETTIALNTGDLPSWLLPAAAVAGGAGVLLLLHEVFAPRITIASGA